MVREFALAFTLAAVAHAQEWKTATSHSMQYYLSLPDGWSAGKTWPVIVAVESANRDFRANAEAFARARGKLPFIVVSPVVVTGGGAGYRDVPSYRYTDAAWSEIERVGPFRFDETGIAAIVANVHRLYGGEERYFLTGWEAGGHTVWAMLFQHPERLRAVAPVSTNYLGRWMTPESFSASPARTQLPVRVFQSAQVPSPYFAQQTVNAIALAREHGYGNVSLTKVDRPHGPLAEEVVRWFAEIVAAR
jgi:poly(3-hydroxybutyrate) depolymerase